MRRLITAALALLLAVQVQADPPTFEKLTVAGTAVGLSTSTISPQAGQRRHCVLTLETGQIRYRLDGLNPAADTGHIFDIGAVLVLDNHEDMRAIRFIRVSSTSGVLSVSCW
jgi:hypothetical protein